MCGDRTLFGSLKRFAEPLEVNLADNSTILAYRKGQIELRTGTGRNLSLRESWYVPELDKVKLVSIISLNNHNIEVVFKLGRTVKARKEGRVIFTGSTRSGLVCLDVEPLQREVAYATTGPLKQSKAVTDRTSVHTDYTDKTGVRKSGTLSTNTKINL